MRAITKKEAYDLYDKLSELAHALAAAQGVTPQNCSDPICQRWRRLQHIADIDEGYLLILTEYDSTVFALGEQGIVGDIMYGGIMTVPAKNFKAVHRDDKMLTIEYTDGCIEHYKAEEGLTDVYRPHSSNRTSVKLPFDNSEN